MTDAAHDPYGKKKIGCLPRPRQRVPRPARHTHAALWSRKNKADPPLGGAPPPLRCTALAAHLPRGTGGLPALHPRGGSPHRLAVESSGCVHGMSPQAWRQRAATGSPPAATTDQLPRAASQQRPGGPPRDNSLCPHCSQMTPHRRYRQCPHRWNLLPYPCTSPPPCHSPPPPRRPPNASPPLPPPPPPTPPMQTTPVIPPLTFSP